ncbi:heavy metal translocating P-type ATPase [Beggiatoa sp. SS]|nr:heavy metal translocating P-type ATPase [Beggiatoa sp. SS]
MIEDKIIQVGSVRFMTREGIAIPKKIEDAMTSSHTEGHSLVMVAINHHIYGAIEIRPFVRPEVKQIISDLRQRGIKHIAIVSGIISNRHNHWLKDWVWIAATLRFCQKIRPILLKSYRNRVKWFVL